MGYELPTVKHEMAIDTETFDPELQEKGPGFVYNRAKVIGISIYTDTGFSAYYPLRHSADNVNAGPILRWLDEHLRNPLITSIYANARYDLEALNSLHIEVKNYIVDIQVLDALLDEEQRSYSLDSLCKRYGQPPKLKNKIEEALIRAGYHTRGKPNWAMLFKLPPKLVGEYAEYDAKSTFEIFQLQKPKIDAEDLREVAQLESELIPVLHSMRISGVPVDIPQAEIENEKLKLSNSEMLQVIEKEFPGINVFSPAQLGETVIARGLQPNKTEKGNDSVSNEFLLASGDDLLVMIGKFRQQEKIRRDFIEGMILNGSFKGTVFPQWFSTRGSSFMSGDDTGGTRSGRIACANPNLSQIPSRHPVLGPIVRSLFIPIKDTRWFKGDLSQQEPRISLHYAYLLKLSGAAEARQVYIDNPNTDYHNLTMDMVNKFSPMPIDRKQAKTINLGVAYGMGKQKLANGLKLPLGKSKQILLAYNSGFPFMKELLDYCANVAEQRGFVKTIMGRRRRFDMWEPPYFQKGKFPIKGREAAIAEYGTVRRASLHKAMNSVVQGTAAEQMKRALVQIHAEKIPLHITLYDEVGASVGEEIQAKRIKEITENVFPFTVPQVMDYKLLKSWGGL